MICLNLSFLSVNASWHLYNIYMYAKYMPEFNYYYL